MICGRCSGIFKESEAEAREIVFTYLGMQVKTFKVGSLCNDCVQAEWIREFKDADIRKFTVIDLLNGKLKVNWQRYEEYFYTGSGSGMHREYIERSHHTLKELGIFSHEAKGNWEIVALGRLNPRGYTGQLYYFTNERDAIEFARLRSRDGLEIHHIDEVIYNEQIKILKDE